MNSLFICLNGILCSVDYDLNDDNCGTFETDSKEKCFEIKPSNSSMICCALIRDMIQCLALVNNTETRAGVVGFSKLYYCL